MTGRSPSGRAGRPAAQAPAGLGDTATIPNAARLLPGDLVQITDPDHHWFPTIIVVSELKSFGIQGFAFMPTNDGSGTGEAYIRLRSDEFEPLGASCIILSESTVRERTAAEAAQ